MWVLKNNDEYDVIVSTKKQAIMKFKRDLDIDVKGYMIRKVW